MANTEAQAAATDPTYELALRRAAAIKQFSGAYVYQPRSQALIDAARAAYQAIAATPVDEALAASTQAEYERVRATLP